MVSRLNLFSFLLRLTVWTLPGPAFLLAIVAGEYIFNSGAKPEFLLTPHAITFLVVANFVWVVLTGYYNIVNVADLFRGVLRARNLATCAFMSCVIGLAVLFFEKASGVLPRTFLLLAPISLLVCAILARTFFRVWLQRMGEHGTPLRLLVIGSDYCAARAVRRLRSGSVTPIEIVGFVRIPGQTALASMRGCVYEFDQLERLVRTGNVEEVVIAVAPDQMSVVGSVITMSKPLRVPVRIIVDLGRRFRLRDRLVQMGNLQIVTLEDTPREKLSYLLLKRIFDVVFSAGILVILAPLMVLIAIAVKLSSPGPVLFRQQRVGLDGKLFNMYKFRTMRVSAPSESDTVWTTTGDPRRTAIGALLRRSSLDELPQFFNVLRGDMSVVGPRPERPHFVRKFEQEYAGYRTRHHLRVGITGWAQVKGYRGDTSIERRVEHDLYYIENWSFWFDLRIVAMTIINGLVNKNAY